MQACAKVWIVIESDIDGSSVILSVHGTEQSAISEVEAVRSADAAIDRTIKVRLPAGRLVDPPRPRHVEIEEHEIVAGISP